MSTASLLGALAGYPQGAHAACSPVGGSDYECSDANTAPQSIADDDASVVTLPGFSVDTSGGNAVTITGDGVSDRPSTAIATGVEVE